MNCGFCVWIVSGLDATLNATRTGQRETENWLNKKPKLKPKPKLKFKNTTLKTIVKRTREREWVWERERNTQRVRESAPACRSGCDSAREREGRADECMRMLGVVLRCRAAHRFNCPFSVFAYLFLFLSSSSLLSLSFQGWTNYCNGAQWWEREWEILAECSRARRMLER